MNKEYNYKMDKLEIYNLIDEWNKKGFHDHAEYVDWDDEEHLILDGRFSIQDLKDLIAEIEAVQDKWKVLANQGKYRKKPVIVEAKQWFPGKQVRGVTETFYANPDGTIIGSSGYGFVTTIHGQETTVAPGDWIITEPDGIHHYPCKPDIFTQTYDPIESPEN